MNELDRRTLKRLNKEYEILPDDKKGWWIDVAMLCFGILIVVGMMLWNPMQI